MEIVDTIELEALDLRYESCRLKKPKAEERLLLSVLQKGILTPLRGVRIGEVNCLLDGFKRVRCAKKLDISLVPFLCMGNDEAMGIIDLMRESFSKGLHIFEQVKLIDELQTKHGLSVGDIAAQLGKSKAWVSVRAAMIRTLTPPIADHIFSGRFPARSFLYTILPFTRVNAIAPKEIEQFINRTAGKGFSTRNIALLAREYFAGSSEVKQQIEKGDPKWVLERLQENSRRPSSRWSTLEQFMLKQLEAIHSGMQTLVRQGDDPKLKSAAFFAQANLLSKGILTEMESFSQTTRRLYDRSR